MKIIHFVFVLSILFFMSCSNQSQSDNLSGDVVKNPKTASGQSGSESMPAIRFDKYEYDFGRIYDGERVKCHFKFENTGNGDLIISNAKGSCGCTVPDYPKTPIKPGEGGSIAVEFNSSGRRGQQVKSITVLTNAQPASVVLTVKAMVVEP
jgi:hypothetical protein